MYTSLGYHTFVISKSLTREEADLLFEELKKYRNETGEIYIKDSRRYNHEDPFGRHYDIVYLGQNKGIWWKMRFSNKGFCINEEYKPCSIKAVINPKVLVGEKSYIIAANAGYLRDVEEIFDYEARKISLKLAGFHQYSLNRIDYCVNFDISELKIDCPPDLMKRLPGMLMTLIKCGDIPDHFTEEYGESENGEYEFYLKSKSIVINCYWKFVDLRRNFIGCKDLKKSYDIIRFEVQFKYPKVCTISSDIKKERESQRKLLVEKIRKQDFMKDQSTLGEGEKKQLINEYRNSCLLDNVAIMKKMLSDERCGETIENYFNKVVKSGDYYTFDKAKKTIELKVPSRKKVARLTNALQMVHDFRGIAKVKAAFRDREEGKLEEFRRSLRDLDDIHVNPVTIPEEWRIDYIPNLLDNYFILCAEEQRKIQDEIAKEQLLQEYITDCKKRKVPWI